MAVEYTPPSFSGATPSALALTQAFADIHEALQYAISVRGTVPNQMEADLDMNGRNILNVGSVDSLDVETEPTIDLGPLEAAVATLNANVAALAQTDITQAAIDQALQDADVIINNRAQNALDKADQNETGLGALTGRTVLLEVSQAQQDLDLLTLQNNYLSLEARVITNENSILGLGGPSSSGIDRTGFVSLDLGADQDRPNFSSADWVSLWNSGSLSNWFDDNENQISVKTINGRTALEIQHVPDSPNGTVSVQGGGTLNAGFVTSMSTVQNIWIPSGFDFGTNSQATIKAGFGIRSQANASGGLTIPEGFSCRPQIRRSGGIEYYGAYVYQSNTAGFGDDELTDVPVIYDEWVEYAQEVVMNSAYGVADGSLKIYINGELKKSVVGIPWMSLQNSGDPSVPSIRGMSFHSFHGGSGNSNWSPGSNQYPAYSNIAYKTGTIT